MFRIQGGGPVSWTGEPLPNHCPEHEVWNWSSNSRALQNSITYKTYCDPNREKWFLPSANNPISHFSPAPGSGRRSCILDRRSPSPSQPTTTISSKIFPCRVGQFTQHSEKRGKSQSGILAGSIKNGIMNLTIFMFYLSVSVYLFLSSQISYKFPDREGDNSLGLAKTIILDFWDFVTSEYYILVPVKKNAYWLKYLHCCFMIGYMKSA